MGPSCWWAARSRRRSRASGSTWFHNGQRIAYFKYRAANGITSIDFESRDLKGADPQLLVSNPRIPDVLFAGPERLIYTVREPPPNQYDSNLWALHFDQKTGKPQGTPRRLTDWTGFYFGNPQLTSDGKRLVFFNGRQQSDVYLGELSSGGKELKSPQRLTLDDRVDWPGGWSAVSKTVFLYSDRNGHFDIHKQAAGERTWGTEVLAWRPWSTPLVWQYLSESDRALVKRTFVERGVVATHECPFA